MESNNTKGELTLQQKMDKFFEETPAEELIKKLEFLGYKFECATPSKEVERGETVEQAAERLFPFETEETIGAGVVNVRNERMKREREVFIQGAQWKSSAPLPKGVEGLQWVKASERNPDKEGYYYTYRHENKVYKQMTFWYADKKEWSSLTYEWLDESPTSLPVNKDRVEEAAKHIANEAWMNISNQGKLSTLRDTYKECIYQEVLRHFLNK